jgi:hypothetical protein
MRPAASVTKSTDSEERTLPEERTTLSNTCGCTITPLTTIDPVDDPDFGAGSLLLGPHEETRNEQQTTIRENEMRSVATMVLKFLVNIMKTAGKTKNWSDAFRRVPR